MPGSSPEDDEIDSAVTPETVEAVTPEPKTDGDAAAPSTAEKPGSMLDAVKAAIEPKDATPPVVPDKDAPADADAQTPDAKDKSDELSPEEFAKLSQKTQSRLKRLNSESKAYRAQIDTLTPKAKEYDAIEGFVKDAGLSHDNIRGALELAVLLKHNPRGALDEILPLVQGLQKIVGEQLSPDLQKRVDQGFLTEEDAKALSRAQANEKLATQRATQTQEQQRAAEAVREQQEATNLTLQSVDVWEKQQLKSDPDFSEKRKDVAEQVELAILKKSNELRRPYFPTPKEAVEMAKTALETVNKRYARFTPKPREIKPENGNASPRSTPEPKNFLDVVRQAAAV